MGFKDAETEFTKEQIEQVAEIWELADDCIVMEESKLNAFIMCTIPELSDGVKSALIGALIYRSRDLAGVMAKALGITVAKLIAEMEAA